VTGARAIAVGNTVTVAGADAVAIGTGTSAGFAGSVAIGQGAATTRANQQAFGTTASTYTMAGVTSAASRTAQTGPVQVVTSDAGGNLATETLAGLGLATGADVAAINAQLATMNGQISDLYGRSSRAYSGVAMAFAMAGVPTLMPTEKFAAALNYGTFLGQSGFALNAAARVTDQVQVTAGLGYGANERIAGGRLGLRVGW
jgi:autotransporter adhesin